MDIKILDSWLREYLETKASPAKIGECLSLCGPSIERIEKYGSDHIYDIEVTTNRVDTASVYGIAKEAAAILPRFGISAKLKEISVADKNHTFVKTVDYIKAQVDSSLCQRFTAVLIKEVKIGKSPEYLVKRLESAGVRSINNVVDISNYIMIELGQPVHTFDYDKIEGAKMILRESKKGESITTLDSKNFKLGGGDIVIEDGEGRLIDLAGVMGGNLSMVDENTKNVLLFVQTYNPERIRKTSMSLAQRTNAATIFEKGLDTELVAPGILKAISMFKDLTKGKVEEKILDIYPSQVKVKKVNVTEKFILARLGINIPKKEIVSYLNSLGIKSLWSDDVLTSEIPSYRQKDVLDAEDLVEEIARIYGYHNLPSIIMSSAIPERPPSKEFAFEDFAKDILSGWGGIEIYSLSLVSLDWAGGDALALKNPLGKDTEYLRTSLMPSIKAAAIENAKISDKFHIYEMSNVYKPVKKDLPKEIQTLAGVFYGYSYAEAKGVIEALFLKLNIDCAFDPEERIGFDASRMVSIKSKSKEIGVLGYLESSDFIYYEFETAKLFALYKAVGSYEPVPKFPAQIEDITFVMPEKTRMGDVLESIKLTKNIKHSELKDVYENSYTFRVWYQNPDKTLTDSEVSEIRKIILETIKTKFGGTVRG